MSISKACPDVKDAGDLLLLREILLEEFGPAYTGLITREDGNPLGWLARRRIASGHGAEGNQTDIVGFFFLEEEYRDPTVAVVLLNQTKRW